MKIPVSHQVIIKTINSFCSVTSQFPVEIPFFCPWDSVLKPWCEQAWDAGHRFCWAISWASKLPAKKTKPLNLPVSGICYRSKGITLNGLYRAQRVNNFNAGFFLKLVFNLSLLFKWVCLWNDAIQVRAWNPGLFPTELQQDKITISDIPELCLLCTVTRPAVIKTWGMEVLIAFSRSDEISPCSSRPRKKHDFY